MTNSVDPDQIFLRSHLIWIYGNAHPGSAGQGLTVSYLSLSCPFGDILIPEHILLKGPVPQGESSRRTGWEPAHT